MTNRERPGKPASGSPSAQASRQKQTQRQAQSRAPSSPQKQGGQRQAQRQGPLQPTQQAPRPTSSPPLTAKARHFSMLRGFHLADVFTLGNAACGVAAVLLAMRYLTSHTLDHFFIAAGLALVALVFDVLDGRIARWRQTQSALGRELDSLADVISFGVAPAALAFAAGMNGGWDGAVLVYFVCCGVSRLARYNVTAESMAGADAKVAYFEGTPIPTSVVLVAVLAFAAWQSRIESGLYGGTVALGPWELHPLVLMFAVSGTLMISKTLRIPKL